MDDFVLIFFFFLVLVGNGDGIVVNGLFVGWLVWLDGWRLLCDIGVIGFLFIFEGLDLFLNDFIVNLMR